MDCSVERYDAGDGKKQIGLLVLSSMQSSRSSKILGFMHQVGLTLGFVYCRSTPNNAEIKAMNKYFLNCVTLKSLCGEEKYSALKEITS